MLSGNPNRTLHLVDIENLTGTPTPTGDAVRSWRQEYTSRFVASGDFVVVASNHLAFATVGFAWTGARHLVRSGPDGADLALLDVIADERVEKRFSSVVIASGDGIFTEAAAWLASHGVQVKVVTRPGSLARRLQLAAGCVVTVDLARVEEVSA